MLRKITFGILIVCLCLSYVGCSGKSTQRIQVTPTASQTAPVINLASVIKRESSQNKQSLELRNCDGKTELQRSLAAETQVICHASIANHATSTKTGATVELSAEMKARIAQQVRNTHQQMCAEAQTSVEQTYFVVPINRIRVFEIYWTKQVFNSTFSFPMDDDTYTASYTYSLDIPAATVTIETGCTA